VALNQYKAGTVSYLNVIVAQTTALSSERTAVYIRGRRMAASVLLIKALGGDWERPKEQARSGAPGGNGQNP
jgi:outer membrane protein TolC